MTKNAAAKITGVATKAVPPTKNQQVLNLLSRNAGATLEEMSTVANWLPHSTRAFLTRLRKRGYAIDSAKTNGVRRYRATSTPAS